MRTSPREQFHYFLGIIASFFLHLAGAAVAILIWEHHAATAAKAPEIFSVTLEGGEKLGGITQIPKNDKSKKPLVDVDAAPWEDWKPESSGSKTETASAKGKDAAVQEKAPEKNLTTPSVVDDPEKILAEKRKQEELQKQQRAKEEKERERKQKEEDAKKKAESEAQKQAAEKKRGEDERKARDRALAAATHRLRSRYEGESANAGGVGFGAARLGGTGMGGGTLAPAEKIAYSDALQRHVKEGWNWLPGTAKLRAQVRVHILPNGVIDDVRVEESSGNSNFDDSVVRAIRKASPVPPPPEKFAADFEDVRFWFDSHEQ